MRRILVPNKVFVLLMGICGSPAIGCEGMDHGQLHASRQLAIPGRVELEPIHAAFKVFARDKAVQEIRWWANCHAYGWASVRVSSEALAWQEGRRHQLSRPENRLHAISVGSMSMSSSWTSL